MTYDYADSSVIVLHTKDLGFNYHIIRGDMSRLPDNSLECAVYFYPTVEAAKQGLGAGGSGFLIGIQSTMFPDLKYTYIVTNRHVVREGHCLVVRMNTPTGSTLVLESTDDAWTEHPDGDDLIVASLGALPPGAAQYKMIEASACVTPEIIADYGIGIGDEVAMIGRFVNHDGKQRNMPSARFGNISIMSLEPMTHPSGRPQESFAVEMRSVSGFSGSPVLVRITTYEPRPDAKKRLVAKFGEVGFRYFLLGVDWGHLPEYYPVYEKRSDGLYKTQPRLVAEANTYLSGVVPAWKLTEILNMDKYRLAREQEEAKLAGLREPKIAAAAILDIAQAEVIDTPDDEGFSEEDFEEALRKVSRPNATPPDQG